MAPRAVLLPLSYRRVTHVLTKRYSNRVNLVLFIGIASAIILCLSVGLFCARQAARRALRATATPPVVYPHTGPNLTCRNAYCTRPNCLKARKCGTVDNHGRQAVLESWSRTELGCTHGCGPRGCSLSEWVEMGSREAPVFRASDENSSDGLPNFGEVTEPPPAYVKKLPPPGSI